MGKPRNTIESIFDRLIPAHGCCIVWIGGKNEKGYGRANWGGVSRVVHRIVYEHFRGPIPEGLELDHLCKNRACCNPDHLEPVTHQENCRRGDAGKLLREKHRAITHCPRGHPYSQENTYIKPSGVGRVCRLCRCESMRRLKARRRKVKDDAIREQDHKEGREG